VASDGDTFAIRRRRGQTPFQVDRNNHDVGLQVPRKALADHKFSLQSGRQAIPFSQARRQVSVIFAVPTPEFVAVMTCECVAAAIVIVVVVSMFTPVVPPMSVAVVFSVILVVVSTVIFIVLVLVGKSCVSGKDKEAENDDRKAFSSIQRFPPTENWLGL
jgi:hypothetical protein